jgi:hypothetical protein
MDFEFGIAKVVNEFSELPADGFLFVNVEGGSVFLGEGFSAKRAEMELIIGGLHVDPNRRWYGKMWGTLAR